jgi:hypothetical protein
MPSVSKQQRVPTPPPLLCVLYVSRVRASLRRADIDAIILVSLQRNRADGITGFLIRAGENFIEYLEGTQSCVANCFRRIERDPHHTNVSLIACARLCSRQFSSWEMRYFRGDANGTEQLEPTFFKFQGGDRALIDEAVRINSAAYRPKRAANLAIELGIEVAPGTVLLRHYRRSLG